MAGVIVDGACRDVDEAAEIGFPVFARSATPVSARGRTAEEATDVPVTVGDVTVEPGIWWSRSERRRVYPGGSAEEVLAAAERIVDRERSMLGELAGGATVADSPRPPVRVDARAALLLGATREEARCCRLS